MHATWSLMQIEAPDLAAVIERRLGAHKHHLLATLRIDGSPRVSGTEVEIIGDDVTVGMMPHSRKLHDVRRDPRVELHTAPIDLELAEPDVKLHGELVELGPIEEGMGPEGWRFALRLSSAAAVAVDGDELVVTSWCPGGPPVVIRRR